MSSATWRPSVVVAMPCYDEEGLAEFIDEIEEHLSPWVRWLRFVVVDDCSPVIPPRRLLKEHQLEFVRVESNLRNLGHGPTVMSAYAHALAEGSDVVVHVDGDGQFHGADFVSVLRALEDADVVVGERAGRTDPWFRRCITGLLTGLVRTRAGEVRDVNSPLRAYRADALRRLHELVPPLSCVPHVLLTLRMKDLAMAVATIPVHSRARRGSTELGTMWTPSPWARFLPSKRLLRLCAQATREVFKGLRHSVPPSTESQTPAPAAA